MNPAQTRTQEFGSGSLLTRRENRARRISVSGHLGFAILLSLLVAATACNSPTDPGETFVPLPGPPTPASGGIVGVVCGAPEGRCLIGATVEVLDGPLAGQSHQQSYNDCNSGHYTVGFRFLGLPLNTPVTVRASMAGYISKVQTITTRADTTPPAAFYVDWEATSIFLSKE